MAITIIHFPTLSIITRITTIKDIIIKWVTKDYYVSLFIKVIGIVVAKGSITDVK